MNAFQPFFLSFESETDKKSTNLNYFVPSVSGGLSIFVSLNCNNNFCSEIINQL